MLISIASIPIEIDDSLLNCKVHSNLFPFSIKDTINQNIIPFQVLFSHNDSFLDDFSPTTRLDSIQYQESGSQITVSDQLSCYRIDTEKRFMEIYPVTDKYFSDLNFLNYLKLLLSLLVLEKGGILLHSSAVFKDQTALVFTGKSSSGKSTISQMLSSSWEILNDEFNILMPKQNQVLAYSTPFGKIKRGNEFSPIVDTIFIIKKSVNNKISLISERNSFFNILKNTCSFPSTDFFGSKLFECVQQLSESVNIRELCFTKDDSLVNFFNTSYSMDTAPCLTMKS